MSNSGYARPVILICRASDSTPFSSGRRLSVDFRQRRRRRPPLARLAPAKLRSGTAERPAAPAFGPWPAPSGRGGPRRSPRGRLSSRRGPGGPSRRGGRGPRDPGRRGDRVVRFRPRNGRIWRQKAPCAQAGRKSLSRSSSLSGNMLIASHQALYAARLANAAKSAWNGSRPNASVGWHYSRGRLCRAPASPAPQTVHKCRGDGQKNDPRKARKRGAKGPGKSRRRAPRIEKE